MIVFFLKNFSFGNFILFLPSEIIFHKFSKMDLVRIFVKSISYSQSQNEAFVLIMQELESDLKIPIVIGAFEAQAIVLELDRSLIRPRPLTHDLFKNFADSFQIKITKVVIYNLEEGIFYSNMVCEQNAEEKVIEARTSDAIALALRFNAPIYMNLSVLKKAGIYLPSSSDDLPSAMESVEEIDERENGISPSKFGKYSTAELKKMLQDCIESEDYELAAQIRDEISNREI